MEEARHNRGFPRTVQGGVRRGSGPILELGYQRSTTEWCAIRVSCTKTCFLCDRRAYLVAYARVSYFRDPLVCLSRKGIYFWW